MMETRKNLLILVLGFVLFAFPNVAKPQVAIERADAVCSNEPGKISALYLFLDKPFTIYENIALAKQNLEWTENLSASQQFIVKDATILPFDTKQNNYLNSQSEQSDAQRKLKAASENLGKVQGIIAGIDGLLAKIQGDLNKLDGTFDNLLEAEKEAAATKDAGEKTKAENRSANNNQQIKTLKDKIEKNFEVLEKVFIKALDNGETPTGDNVSADDQDLNKIANNNVDLSDFQKNKLKEARASAIKSKENNSNISDDIGKARKSQILVKEALSELEKAQARVKEAVNYEAATALGNINKAFAELSTLNSPKNFYVLKPETENGPQIYKIESAELDLGTETYGYAPNLVKLTAAAGGINIETSSSYYIVASKISFNGKMVEGLLQQVITFPNPCKIDKPEEKTGDSSFYARTETKGKEDSEVFFEASLKGANNDQVFEGLDFNFSIPLRKPLKRDYALILFSNARLVTDPKSNPSSVELGVKLQHSHPFKVSDLGEDNKPNYSFFPGFRFEVGVKGEATQNIIKFPFANVAGFGRITFPANLIDTENMLLQVNPFFGTELGINIKNLVPEARRKPIVRLLSGVTVKFQPFRSRERQPVVFEGNYEYRNLLRSETGVTKDDDGNLKALFFGRGPRHFVEFNLKFPWSKYFQPFVEYKYGKLPPSFELFDHKFTAGLTYKFGFKKN